MTSDLKNPSADAELAELVALYLDNRLNTEQRNRLEARIEKEPAAMEYLAQRLRFEAALRDAINPQRMEVLESRRMIMEPGVTGPEWFVDQQRSVRIGRVEEPLTLEISPTRQKRTRWFVAGTILLAVFIAAWFLWPRPQPQVISPSLALRNADFEATDLSLTPQGFTSTLVEWQEAFACPEVELVEIARYSQGAIFPKSGKNVARMLPGGYINQYLRFSNGSPLLARDGLTVRLNGWAWIESSSPKTITASLRVVASGRPDTIIYDACRSQCTMESSGWQRFRIDMPITGDLMRSPFWVEPRVTSKPPLDLTGRELSLSIDRDNSPGPILLDDLAMEIVTDDDASLTPVSLLLHHSQAKIHGSAHREPDKDCIGRWEDDNTTVTWSIRVNAPAEIEIECFQAAEARSAGNGYDVVIGKEKVSGKVLETGAWDRFEYVKVGRIKIPDAGEYQVSVVPHPRDSLAVMNLRGLRISGPKLSAEVLNHP
jgi:hypothetical protein